jgi:hypothetical protein
LLLVIAGVCFWHARNPRRGIRPGIIASLWIVFALYLFVRSDPEAWPRGPLGLVESLRDPTVLQHKILACLPVGIGVGDGLYGYGLMRGQLRTWLISALAFGGGGSSSCTSMVDGFTLTRSTSSTSRWASPASALARG